MIKKVSLIIVVLSIMVSLTACGGGFEVESFNAVIMEENDDGGRNIINDNVGENEVIPVNEDTFPGIEVYFSEQLDTSSITLNIYKVYPDGSETIDEQKNLSVNPEWSNVNLPLMLLEDGEWYAQIEFERDGETYRVSTDKFKTDFQMGW